MKSIIEQIFLYLDDLIVKAGNRLVQLLVGNDQVHAEHGGGHALSGLLVVLALSSLLNIIIIIIITTIILIITCSSSPSSPSFLSVAQSLSNKIQIQI